MQINAFYVNIGQTYIIYDRAFRKRHPWGLIDCAPLLAILDLNCSHMAATCTIHEHIVQQPVITKTRLFKYTENFTIKK